MLAWEGLFTRQGKSEVSKIPIKTRLPLEAWVAAAVVTLLSTLSFLAGGTAVPVAPNMPAPVERAWDAVKASFVGDHHTPHRGKGLFKGLSQ
jgi:hypothetical protein